MKCEAMFRLPATLDNACNGKRYPRTDVYAQSYGRPEGTLHIANKCTYYVCDVVTFVANMCAYIRLRYRKYVRIYLRCLKYSRMCEHVFVMS